MYVKRGTRTAWVAANQGRFLCLCGCETPIRLRPEHFNVGVPNYVHGHNPGPYKKRVMHSGGYVMVWRPRHPFGNPYVLEHRLVVEEHLGANDPDSVWLTEIDGEMYLRREVDVHHVNEVKDDNRIENLEVLDKGEHARLHNLKR